MKKLLLLALVTLSTLFSACLFEDDEEEWDAEKVCPETGMNAYGMPNRGTFVDERDGRVYKYTTIGDQVWMAENLKFELPYPYSLCYGKTTCYVKKRYEYDDGVYTCFQDTAHLAEISQRMQSTCTDNDCIAEEWCEKVGRYYTLYENGADAGLLNRALIDTICPNGWHIPTYDEWVVLKENVEADASRLKSSDSSFFNSSHANMPGDNDCGFSVFYNGAIQGKNLEGVFDKVRFGTSTSRNEMYSYIMIMEHGYLSYTTTNVSKYSIRCLKD